MIKIPRYTAKDLELFKGKKIVICGPYHQAIEIFNIFKYFGIDVIGISSKKVYRENYIKYPTINMKKLLRNNNIDSNIIVQYVDHYDGSTEQGKMKISPLFGLNIISSFRTVLIIDSLCNADRNAQKSHMDFIQAKLNDKYKRLVLQGARRPRNAIIVCNPPKTADHTLNNTFSLINKESVSKISMCCRRINFKIYDICKRIHLYRFIYNLLSKNNNKNSFIDYVNTFHYPKVFDSNLYKDNTAIKIITATREPISQNLSALYERLDSGGGVLYQLWLLNNFASRDMNSKSKFICELKNTYIRNGDNIQTLFDFQNKYMVYPVNDGISQGCLIQNFFEEFNECIVNLYANPFDKEKGYSVIKEGNIEVFVYQLEKLNEIIPQLSEWIGVPFDKLENGNVAVDKWVGESYKQAQKEIEISQEYFDRCYNEEYVKHFYSEEDIEKFKERWRPHIKK